MTSMTPEEYAKAHQKSFRIAFDFLREHFPPGSTEEWWLQTAEEGAAASEAGGDPELTMQLVIAVNNYIGLEQKRRETHEQADH